MMFWSSDLHQANLLQTSFIKWVQVIGSLGDRWFSFQYFLGKTMIVSEDSDTGAKEDTVLIMSFMSFRLYWSLANESKDSLQISLFHILIMIMVLCFFLLRHSLEATFRVHKRRVGICWFIASASWWGLFVWDIMSLNEFTGLLQTLKVWKDFDMVWVPRRCTNPKNIRVKQQPVSLKQAYTSISSTITQYSQCSNG